MAKKPQRRHNLTTFKKRKSASKRRDKPAPEEGRDTTGRFITGIKNGGAAPGAGLKPAMFKEAMRDIASHPEALQFIDDVVQGRKCDVKYTMFGKEYKARPSASIRGMFWIEARNAGYGRPPQALQLGGNVIDLAGLAEAIAKAETERGLPRSE